MRSGDLTTLRSHLSVQSIIWNTEYLSIPNHDVYNAEHAHFVLHSFEYIGWANNKLVPTDQMPTALFELTAPLNTITLPYLTGLLIVKLSINSSFDLQLNQDHRQGHILV